MRPGSVWGFDAKMTSVRLAESKDSGFAAGLGGCLQRGTRRCAWQESNLLPFGPEPNALSGELQARDSLCSLNCGPRGSGYRGRWIGRPCRCMSEQHASRGQPAPKPDAIDCADGCRPPVGRYPRGFERMPWVRSDRRLHCDARACGRGSRWSSPHAMGAASRLRRDFRGYLALHRYPGGV
jgi:hypothetical protein